MSSPHFVVVQGHDTAYSGDGFLNPGWRVRVCLLTRFHQDTSKLVLFLPFWSTLPATPPCNTPLLWNFMGKLLASCNFCWVGRRAYWAQAYRKGLQEKTIQICALACQRADSLWRDLVHISSTFAQKQCILSLLWLFLCSLLAIKSLSLVDATCAKIKSRTTQQKTEKPTRNANHGPQQMTPKQINSSRCKCCGVSSDDSAIYFG